MRGEFIAFFKIACREGLLSIQAIFVPAVGILNQVVESTISSFGLIF